MRKLPSDAQVEFLRKLLIAMVRGIVEHDDQVMVDYAVTPARVVFTVNVHHSDMGLVLGERGATSDAIRRIVWTAAKKTDRRVDIDIV